ncbi:MAG: hypothetical protein JWM95_678 [Gemmatimonadetes bacterium]|nr:hypothetical protein [Gemmatimonadota bacterium]
MIGHREKALFILAIVSAFGAGVRVLRAAGEQAEFAPKSLAVSAERVAISDDSIAEAAGNAVANDPFRLANRPSAMRFDARTEGGGPGAVLPPPPVRPAFVLRAIVGGPPWQAIVDGIPGQPSGTIVRTGGVFDKLTVRTITRDTVVIQAPDTTWKLTIKRDR